MCWACLRVPPRDLPPLLPSSSCTDAKQDVWHKHGSAHLGQFALLPPRRRAPLEQRCAWVQQTYVICGGDPLALVPVLEYVGARGTARVRTHEVTNTAGESRAACLPQGLDPGLIRPRQSLVFIHLDVRILGIVVGAVLESLGRLAFEIDQRQVEPGNHAESLARKPRQLVIGHVGDEPRDTGWIATEASAFDHGSNVFSALRNRLQDLVCLADREC